MRLAGYGRLTEADSTSSGGADASVAWMASASARADSALSSTATRADGPFPGLRKSMFSVCSAGACTG